MSEQTPQSSTEVSRDVDNAFDPEHRKAQTEWNEYLDSRPYESKKGNIKDPETDKKVDSDEYFDKKREDHAEKSNKAYEKMTPYELTRKIAEAKFNGDKTTEQNLYDALLDNIEKQQEKGVNPSRDLFAEYDHRIDEVFQRLHQDAQAEADKNAENEDDAIRAAILDPANVAELRDERARDAEHDDDIAILPPVEPIPPTDPGEVVGGSGTSTGIIEPMPQDPAERPGWFKKHRAKLLATAAGIAIGLGAGFALFGGDKDNKDSQRDSSDNTEQPAEMEIAMEQAPGTSLDGDSPQERIKKNLKFNQSFSDKNHSGNKVNAWGTERSLLVENAPNGELRGEALNEYIGNHDKITAKNVEKLVNVRFQEIHGLDAAKFNSAWGQSEREKMKREYLSDSGHSLSEAGKKAHEIHQNILRSGKTVKMTAAEAAKKYDLDVNSYIKEGKLKGGIDDVAYAAGATHSDIYVTFDKDGNIEHAEIGVCANEVFFVKGAITDIDNPTPETTPPTVEDPPEEDGPNDKKGKVRADSESPADTGGVEADGPGPQETQQQAGGQTETQAQDQADGSDTVAPGATQEPKPATPETGAGGQTSNGSVGE